MSFCNKGAFFEENKGGVRGGAGLRWRPQNATHFEALTEPTGETIPSALGHPIGARASCWHTTLLAKSSVLYLLRPLATERGVTAHDTPSH